MTFRCETCKRDFGKEEGLKQHNRDKHGTGAGEITSQENKPSFSAKKAMRIAKYSIALLIVLALVYLAITSIKTDPLRQGMGSAGSQHVHADVKVYIDGRAIDFSQSRYQLRSNYVHFEERDGDVIHIHATGVRIGFMMQTLGIKFNQTCVVTDRTYCKNGEKTLKFLVNGEQNAEWELYVMRSMDKILLSYGNETDMTGQLDSITSKAIDIDTGRVPSD